ncbi:glycoside hydrolase family 18 protein [Hortaea werneckii]|nr:glycoside hydrolase family 18 protein [Hortaea werneckii]
MIDESGDIVRRTSFLKTRYPGLRINVAIGGWAFNDPPTQNYFSDMASTHPNRQKFISSLIDYLEKYALDGVDIDWEYPAALDRGGRPEDTNNFVLLASEIREAFDRHNPGWEATITIPTSYWYMRGFDLPGLQKYVSYFNLMSYDLHGGWDKHNEFTGPYLEGHTNITEIDNGLDLLWRNDVKPENVVMGFAFYGRSFTMADTSCSTPDGCKFSTTGRPGDCSTTSGILLYEEVVSRNTSLDVHTVYDKKSTVKYNVFDGDQWISYDDAESFADKKKFMSGRCLSGLMIWALDQDTPDYEALAGLIGEGPLANSLLEGGSLDDRSAGALSDAFAAYTGQNCFVTPTCTDGSSEEKTADQVCPAGSISISTAHSPLQAPGHDFHGQCSEGWYRHICCPEDNAPKNCEWNGAPERNSFGCTGKCGDNQFSLNIDPNLCCDSAANLEKCYWTGCQGPISINRGDYPVCPGDADYQTFRYDQDNGDWCSATYDGGSGSNVHRSFGRAFCCPKGKGYQKCHWSNEPQNTFSGDLEEVCNPQQCSSKETQVTTALTPPVPLEVSNEDLGISHGHSGRNCDRVNLPVGHSAEFPYCCEPPSKYSDDWPVDPKYLFSTYYNEAEDDVLWHYSDNYANNNADPHRADQGTEDGSDAYGFVMLDGPPGSLDSDFGNSHTITTRDADPPLVKKSMITSDERVLNSTFDHAEETVYVYCNYPESSHRCQKVWFKGVKDTIIKLPDHIGEGPFARIVSMEPASRDHALPAHHIRARSLARNTNTVYALKFDYNFHLSKRDDPIEMRVDFTNLLEYWDEMTDAPATKKRSLRDGHLSKAEWHEKLIKAKERGSRSRSRRDRHAHGHTGANVEGNSLHKRWFGNFFNWLKRLNTFEDSEVGYLTLALRKSLLLFKASTGCPGSSLFASIEMFFDTDISMDATYAYYFSGTILPPSTPDTYVYFGLEPSAYTGLRLTGNARMQAGTERKKLIDTLSYPGLSVKGLATVGPTLDLYGQISGVIQLKGEMRAGVQVDFPKTEVYWPQDDDASAQYQKLLGIDAKPSSPTTQIAPTFDTAVSAQAQLDVLITPQANIGIQIGGTLTGGSIVDANVHGSIPTDLQLHASARGSAGSSSDTQANYLVGIYFYYNVAFGAIANILGLKNWATSDRMAFEPAPRYTIFEQTDSFSGSTNFARSEVDDNTGHTYIRYPRRSIFDAVNVASNHQNEHNVHNVSDASIGPHNQSWAASSDALLGKRADSDSDGDVAMPDFSAAQQLTCPPGDTSQITLPDFRLNCNVFRSQAIRTRNGGTPDSLPGICEGVKRFFLRRGLANSAITVTWDPKPNRSKVRRRQSCPGGFCSDIQRTLQRNSGEIAKVSCDEFPFASAEEGGDYLSSLDNNPDHAESTCVPAWQNTLQGNCNKILSQIEMNVAYFERGNRDLPDQASIWARWTPDQRDDESEYMEAGHVWNENGVSVPQRIVSYPDQIPRAGPIGTNEYSNVQNPGYYNGFMFRRNVTFGLASPENANDGAAWTLQGTPPTMWQHVGPNGGGSPGNMNQIACAVNTFDQNEVYRFGHNGLCHNGDEYDTGGWKRQPKFSACRIDFGPAARGESDGGSQKRAIGEFNGWQVYGIKMLDDDEDSVVVPDDYMASDMNMPADRTGK